MNDSQLINSLQSAGVERKKAEDLLYITYHYFINEGCKKYHLTEEDSFSAYSDAVLSLIINVTKKQFEGRSSIKTYLFQIFSNKCVDLVRKNTTNKNNVNNSLPVSELLLQLPDNARSAVEKLTDKFKLSVLAVKLKEIGEKCREILLLFEEGFSDKEIAHHLQYQTGEVAKTSRLRCLEKLREKVKTINI